MLTIQVEDMTCKHCIDAITRAVQQADSRAEVDIDLTGKRVTINSVLPVTTLATVISDAGYTPQVI